MPSFVVTSPTGDKFRINAPEGATEEQAIEYAKTQFSQPEAPETDVNKIRAQVEAEHPMPEATMIEQFGRGMMDVYQGFKQLTMNIADKLGESTAADDYNEQLKKEINLYEKNNPEFQIARLAGGIATPLSLVPAGAVGGITARAATYAGTGAMYSMFQPVKDSDEFWTKKGEQAAWGATAGLALPAGAKLFKVAAGWLDEFTKPLYKSGIHRDTVKFLKQTFHENKDKIIKALDNAVKTGDKRTVGQIIADATQGTGDDFGGMIVRLEKELARESDALKSMYARQSKGRQDFIDSIAGTKEEFANAISQRESNAAQNYAAAFAPESQANVVGDKVIQGILDNKFARIAFNEAKDIAKAEGNATPTKLLHYVKLGLDKQLAKSGDQALSIAEKKAVDGIKEKLINWVAKKNPAYEKARQQYQLDSMPINKMMVGQELKKALMTSLDKESPARFNTSLQDAHKILKKATGFDRYKGLEGILSPSEMNGLKNISKELSVEAKAKTMAAASKGSSSEIKGEVVLELPKILSRPIVITNHLLSILGKDRTQDYKNLLIKMVKNPDEFLRAYKGPEKSKITKNAIEIVARLNRLAATQAPAREATALGQEEQ